jgi:6-phosphogluconolactonase
VTTAERHELRLLPTAADAAAEAASIICELLAAALIAAPNEDLASGSQAGRASVAFSGGISPRMMLASMPGVRLQPDWSRIDVFQVDERVAPEGDPSRNLVDLQHHLLEQLSPPPALHPIPVQAGATQAALRYAKTLSDTLGDGGHLSLVHLGLGSDGHCASLVPGDPVLRVMNADVAATAAYQGHERVTMTYPLLNRSSCAVWLVTGESKRAALAALLRDDPEIPATHVRCNRSIIVADQSAVSSADRSVLSSADRSVERVGGRSGGQVREW